MDNKLYKFLFDENIKLLEDLSGFSADDIKKSRKEDCRECRFLLITIAIEYKVSFAQISRFSGFTIPQIERAFSQKEEMLKKFDIRKSLDLIRENTSKNIDDYYSKINV